MGVLSWGLYGSLSTFEELAGGKEEEEDGEGVLYGYNPEGGGVAEVLGDDASEQAADAKA